MCGLSVKKAFKRTMGLKREHMLGVEERWWHTGQEKKKEGMKESCCREVEWDERDKLSKKKWRSQKGRRNAWHWEEQRRKKMENICLLIEIQHRRVQSSHSPTGFLVGFFFFPSSCCFILCLWRFFFHPSLSSSRPLHLHYHSKMALSETLLRCPH